MWGRGVGMQGNLTHSIFATNRHTWEVDLQVAISAHIRSEDSRILCSRERTNPTHKLQGKSKHPFPAARRRRRRKKEAFALGHGDALQPHDEGKGREGKGLPGACSSPVMARRRSSDGGAGRAERRARGRRASGGEETSSTRPELLTVSIADFCSTVRLSISSLLVLIKRRRGGPTTGWKSKIGN